MRVYLSHLFSLMLNQSGEQLVVLANQIVQARHKLDPRQQKVIAWGIAQIARDDSDFLTHTLSITEFAKLTGSESGSLFKEMEAVTKSLLRSIVEIRVDDGDRRRIAFQWLSCCEYREGLGTVEIKFHEKLKPYLLELRSRFTQLRLDRFFKFRSSYTIRFYERVEMQRGFGVHRHSWSMTLEELREWLGIEPEGYKFFGSLRTYVLEIAQRELDVRSDWSFSFEAIKIGRRITGVQFTLRPARSPKVDPNREHFKKMAPELRDKVLTLARKHPRYIGEGWSATGMNVPKWGEEGRNATDAEIMEDSRLPEFLPRFLDEIERGQKALPLD